MSNKTQIYPKLLYSRRAVDKAVADYKRIATITVTEDTTHYICAFTNCVVEPERVMCEFNNYLIELLNAQGEDL